MTVAPETPPARGNAPHPHIRDHTHTRQRLRSVRETKPTRPIPRPGPNPPRTRPDEHVSIRPVKCAGASTAIIADSGNGPSWELDFDRWQSIDPELTVHLHGEAAGEWVCLDATTAISAGTGLAPSVLLSGRGRSA